MRSCSAPSNSSARRKPPRSNKQDLVAKIARDTGATKSSAAAAVDSHARGDHARAQEGRRDHVRRVRHVQDVTAPRAHASNPRTGAAIKIPKRRVVRFTAGKALKSASDRLSAIIFRSEVAYVLTCRRVAQRLERLLDTQEVSGSIPPAPTTFARILARLSPSFEGGSCPELAGKPRLSDSSFRFQLPLVSTHHHPP